MAQLLNLVIGHEEPKAQIKQLLHQQHFPQSMIFVGPESIGKFKTALAVAQSLICSSPHKSEHQHLACGSCGSCLRVEKKSSEDLLIIDPQNQNQIKIDQIRDILKFLSLTSEGEARVILINDAHKMNSQASNALLKTLEEPNLNVYFILITPDVRLLMPTIRSRCQNLVFQRLSLDQLKQIYATLSSAQSSTHSNNFADEDANESASESFLGTRGELWMFEAARGQVKLLEQMTQSSSIEKKNKEFEVFDLFWNDPLFIENPNMKELLKERSFVASLLETWMTALRDLIYIKGAGASGAPVKVIFRDQMRLYRTLNSLSLDVLHRMFQEIFQLEKESDKLDSLLLIESLWVKYARKS